MHKNNKQLEWKVTDTGCWEVTSHAIGNRGYAAITHNGIRQGVHRFIYEELFGSIPDGMVVMHKCDNPRCINPEHLKLGTQAENMKDMVEKKRSLIGERNPNVKLTMDKVRAIKKDKRSYSQIAGEYGVGFGVIGQIKRRERWTHIS